MIKNIKDINLDFVKKYLQIEDGYNDDDMELNMYMIVAKDYLIKKCNITEEDFYNENTLAIPFLLLISEFYGNKNTTILANTKVNFILDRFININSNYK